MILVNEREQSRERPAADTALARVAREQRPGRQFAVFLFYALGWIQQDEIRFMLSLVRVSSRTRARLFTMFMRLQRVT